MVKFTSYSAIRSWVEGRLAPGEKVGILGTFGIGSLTGMISVYTTQPLDVLKTRMQSAQAKQEYGNVFRCAVQILRTEHPSVFWSGALPRMARLMLSGGIMFTIYEGVTGKLVNVPRLRFQRQELDEVAKQEFRQRTIEEYSA